MFRSRISVFARLLTAVTLTCLIGCDGTITDGDPPPEQDLDSPCQPNDDCNPGLVCIEGFCAPVTGGDTGECGNGIVDPGEDCDEGGVDTATCDSDCTAVMCGDSHTNSAAGEPCDDGGESAGCDADCTLVVCGDGLHNEAAGEQCDDGNTVDGDGCSGSCLVSEECGEESYTYHDFTLAEVCTEDDNWCAWADQPGKAVVYGEMSKVVQVPPSCEKLDVTILIPCNGWGEGLAGPDGSSAHIIVNGVIRAETIDDTMEFHHNAFYRYEFCESFVNTFDVAGEAQAELIIRMNGGASMDFQQAALKFYRD